MSKIGKKNITIPKESSIKIEGGNLTISGPKGTKKLTISDKIFSASLNEKEFEIKPLEKKIDKKKIKNDFEILSILRNLKIIGIFTRLAIRDKKKDYLKLNSFKNSEIKGEIELDDTKLMFLSIPSVLILRYTDLIKAVESWLLRQSRPTLNFLSQPVTKKTRER